MNHALLLTMVAAFAGIAESFSHQGTETNAAAGEGLQDAVAVLSPPVLAPLDEESGLPSAAWTVAVAEWLSVEFGLPPMREPPGMAKIPASRLVSIRLQGIDAESLALVSNAAAQMADVVSVYSPVSRTIYLPEGWTGRSPAELSVLVHETVHHLQTEAGQTFACPELREATAFAAQERWLSQFGTDLEAEFGIDGLTLLARTNCLY